MEVHDATLLPQALKCYGQELKAKKLMIVHWGTFRLGDEPVHFPPIQIRRELKDKGLLDRLVALSHGKTLFYKQDSGSS